MRRFHRVYTMKKTEGKHILLLFFCSLILSSLNTHAQFFVGKACIVDVQSNQDGSVSGCPNPTYFFDTDTSSITRTWNFNDPTAAGTVTTRSAQHYFSTPGDYNVTLIKNTPTGSQTVSQIVKVGNLPQQPKFNGKTVADTTVCSNNTLELNPFKLNLPIGNYSYLWYPGGDTTKTITVDSSGCYSVEVFDETSGCSRKAKINVKFCYEESSGGGGSEKWYFGQGATLEFQADAQEAVRDSLAEEGTVFGDPPQDSVTYTPVPGGSNPLVTNTASAMVYGPSGDIAFYTDGINIYNGNDELITDEFGVSQLNGNNTASQAVAVIPKNDCSECPHHQYYVFTKDVDSGLLSYSVIDLRYDDGLGRIVERNVPVAYGVSDKLTVLSQNEGGSFDLYTHEEGNNTFQVIQVDSLGVNVSTQEVGIPYIEEGSETGYIVFSPNGEKMAQAVVIGGQNYVEIYNRDTTGVLTLINTVNLGIAAPPSVYGLSFNEDNRFLYATVSGDVSLGQSSSLLQIPLFLADNNAISGAIEVIATSVTEQFGALQLGPVDVNAPPGKSIYMAIQGSNKLAYIQDPDIQGGPAFVGYIDSNNGIEISGQSGLGLPTIAYAAQSQDGSGVSANYFGNCFNSATGLETQGICDPLRNEVTWEFEDGTSLKGKNVNYTFPRVGWNKIKAVIKVYNTSPIKQVIDNPILNQIVNLTETECTEVILEDSIYIKPSPEISINDSIYVCLRDTPIEAVAIDPTVTGGNEFIYSWFTRSGVPISGTNGDSAIYVKIPETYVLQVENDFQCLSEKDILVEPGCIPEVQFPTAFTPNGANPNFTFYYKYTYNPNLKIYTRWGELIFETNELDSTWNGTKRNKLVPTGIYPYVLTYDVQDFPEWGRQKVVGSVWILR